MPKYTTIHNFDAALQYVSKLGMAVGPGAPGWIPRAQGQLCDAVECMEKGLPPLVEPLVPWPTTVEESASRDRYPYQVRFDRNRREFTVKTKQGKTYTADASSLSLY